MTNDNYTNNVLELARRPVLLLNIENHKNYFKIFYLQPRINRIQHCMRCQSYPILHSIDSIKLEPSHIFNIELDQKRKHFHQNNFDFWSNWLGPHFAECHISYTINPKITAPRRTSPRLTFTTPHYTLLRLATPHYT